MKLVIISAIFGTIICITHSSVFPLKKTLKDQKVSIVGGYNASIEDFPYQVGLYDSGFDMLICGGSIISDRYILTAAHCLTHKNSEYLIRAGAERRREGVVIHVAEVIPHPNYSQESGAMDAGLLKTTDPIEFTDVIKPIKLPPRGKQLKDDSVITVSGWGDLWFNDTNEIHSDGLLKAVNVPVFNFNKCGKIMESMRNESFCAGGTKKGGKGACFGDSGGPAVQDNMIFGIVSRGEPCALPNMPDLYTNVAFPDIRDFIKKHTGL